MVRIKQTVPECIGLIPAAGKAERIQPLPCSKEIFPVGFGKIGQKGHRHPKVAAHYLLEKMHRAGANKAYIVLSKGKWDIPAYFGNGSLVDMAIAYLMTELTYGVPFTLNSAIPFLKSSRVLFGFPDILIGPDEVYIKLLERFSARGGDLVLGLFPAVNPQKMDMVELEDDAAIRHIWIKPAHTNLKWTWIAAVWGSAFTRFMHDYVRRYLQTIICAPDSLKGDSSKEVYLGDVIQAAIESGLTCDRVLFPRGRYLDVGTPEDMACASRFKA